MEPKRAEQNKEINWDEVRRRVEAARLAVERGWTPSQEEKAKVLHKRAVALAAEFGQEIAEDRLNLLVFVISSETYAIESSYVREVYPLREFTPLPCTPPFVLGVINVRGEIIPVNDIRSIFNLPQKGLTELNKVIILEGGEMEMGILADDVIGVASIPLSEVEPPPQTLTGIRVEFLMGVTKERLVVLDAGKMLSDRNIVVHEEVI